MNERTLEQAAEQYVMQHMTEEQLARYEEYQKRSWEAHMACQSVIGWLVSMELHTQEVEDDLTYCLLEHRATIADLVKLVVEAEAQRDELRRLSGETNG